MGLMRRAIAREEQDRRRTMEEERRTQDRFASTLVIAASIIAAVRLAREPDISRPSPRRTAVVAERYFPNPDDLAGRAALSG